MIGIDVGGANVKVVDSGGVHIHYCPMWENAPLETLLAGYRSSREVDAAVVMSGELADCFDSKVEGIRFIVDAVKAAFPQAVFYGTDGCFHHEATPCLAAANWLASADHLRKDWPGAVLVDMGSTTTDIIPLTDFSALLGLTDLARLQKGYLVYTGLLRTSVPALIRHVSLGGVRTPVSPEYFACSGDVHLALGHITAEEYTSDSPDGKGREREAAYRRLARVVCADLSEIGTEGAMAIARAFWEEQSSLLKNTIEEVMAETGATEIITAGIGSRLLARVCGGTDISESLGSFSDALPAFAVREVALRNAGCTG
ncbi:MAG: H4MPT-linked C1 transfer pathway protein [Methanolinea sp. SDB]|nr:MAG: H4MPT-linked C1 transfer pathway protein [Methanolinea sp. SDB]